MQWIGGVKKQELQNYHSQTVFLVNKDALLHIRTLTDLCHN